METSKIMDLKNAVAYAHGAVVSKTLVDKKSGTVTLFAFEEGQGLSEHTAPFDAVVQILDGEAHLTIGGKSFVVSAGEMIVMPAHGTHAVRAEKRFKMLLTMIRG
jgi:quercetin dioxygenase-like cupin family protein